MGIIVYSLSWVMQDLYHQPYDALTNPASSESELGVRIAGLDPWPPNFKTAEIASGS